jgi:hypothetical protein
MTTPLVTKSRRNGNQVIKPMSGGQATPATVSTDRVCDGDLMEASALVKPLALAHFRR